MINLRKYFQPTTLRVIFLVPVAMALSSEDSGGCASTPEPGALSKTQIVELLSGNTVQVKGQESYAFVEANGTMRGVNLPSGGTSGNWSVKDDGTLCAVWTNAPDTSERCAKLQFISKDEGYHWIGGNLVIVEGNPQSL